MYVCMDFFSKVVRLDLIKSIYWSDRYILLKIFKILPLRVDTLLPTWFPRYKVSLESETLWQSIEWREHLRNIFQAPLELGNRQKSAELKSVCMADAARLPWYLSRIGEFLSHNKGGVGWSVVVVELLSIDNLRSFPFFGSVQVEVY